MLDVSIKNTKKISAYISIYPLTCALLAVLIHWTEQIKELLNAQDMTKAGDNCGPLQEIDFWKSRSKKLSDVSQQLQKPAVRHIYSILEFCKSLYVPRFCKLSEQIQVQEVCGSQV